jgi:hypothetical protein
MNRFSKFLFASLLVLSIAACKKNNLVIDKDPLIVPAYAELVLPTFTNKSYFITSDPATEYKIPIGITNVTNSDRTIQLTYTSATAVQGTHFTAPATITIPAGKALDTLRIKGIFANYPTGRKDIVKVKITGGSAPAFFGKDSVNVILQKYCNVIEADLAGDYNNSFEGTYGPYTTTVYDLVSTGATSATAKIDNIYDIGIVGTVIKFDWADPAAFKVIIDAQPTGFTQGGKTLFIRSNPAGTSTFSSCDNTISLKIDLYTTTAGVNTYEVQNYTVSIAK